MPEEKSHNTRNKVKHMRRNFKATVFEDLFGTPEYTLELYKSLYPEDQEATVEDIRNVTINRVLTNGEYNDLGFAVGKRVIILVEAQSTWSENIVIRALFYLVDTLRKEISDFNLFSSKKCVLPKIDVYVVYTGSRKDHPEVLTLKDSFYHEEEQAVDCRVKMVYDTGNGTILDQYINFCQVVSSMLRVYGHSKRAVDMAIKECVNRDILAGYLSARKEGIMDMYDFLFNEEEIQRKYAAELKEESRAEGLSEGRAQGLSEGRAEGRAQGLSEGRAEGHAEGLAEGLYRSLDHFLQRNPEMEIGEAAEMLGFNKEELDAYVRSRSYGRVPAASGASIQEAEEPAAGK